MSDETENDREITTCGVSTSSDRTRMLIYLGSAGSDKSFKFDMPKDLAMYMSNAIERLANWPVARRGAKTLLKAR